MGVSLRVLGRGGVGDPPAGSPWTWLLIALNEESKCGTGGTRYPPGSSGSSSAYNKSVIFSLIRTGGPRS